MIKLLNIRRRAALAGLAALASVLVYPASPQAAAEAKAAGPEEHCSPQKINHPEGGQWVEVDLCLRTGGQDMTVALKNPTCKWYNGATAQTFDDCILTRYDWKLERDGTPFIGLIRGGGTVPYGGPGTYKISGSVGFHASGGPGGGSGDIGNNFSHTYTFTSDRDSTAALVTATATLAEEDSDSEMLAAVLTLTNKGTTTARDLKLQAGSFSRGSENGELQSGDKRCRSEISSVNCSLGDLEPGQSVSVVVKNWQQDGILGRGGNDLPSWEYSYANGSSTDSYDGPLPKWH